MDKILLVEDDLDICEVIRNYFENKAFGFALAGATARFVACLSAMILFLVGDKIIQRKRKRK